MVWNGQSHVDYSNYYYWGVESKLLFEIVVRNDLIVIGNNKPYEMATIEFYKNYNIKNDVFDFFNKTFIFSRNKICEKKSFQSFESLKTNHLCIPVTETLPVALTFVRFVVNLSTILFRVYNYR